MDKTIKTPKITVFMACYNAENFVPDAIASVLNQTFTDFELIIVNDGSNDNRIKLIHNQTNQGLVYTRNQLLTHAKGR